MRTLCVVRQLSAYNFKLPPPIRVYTTNLVWFGSKVLNPVEKTFREYMACDDPNSVIVVDMPYPNHLSRIDYVDCVKVTVYSKCMWSENDVLFIESTKASEPTGPLR
jgi:hypothetical protein